MSKMADVCPDVQGSIQAALDMGNGSHSIHFCSQSDCLDEHSTGNKKVQNLPHACVCGKGNKADKTPAGQGNCISGQSQGSDPKKPKTEKRKPPAAPRRHLKRSDAGVRAHSVPCLLQYRVYTAQRTITLALNFGCGFAPRLGKMAGSK